MKITVIEYKSANICLYLCLETGKMYHRCLKLRPFFGLTRGFIVCKMYSREDLWTGPLMVKTQAVFCWSDQGFYFLQNLLNRRPVDWTARGKNSGCFLLV